MKFKLILLDTVSEDEAEWKGFVLDGMNLPEFVGVKEFKSSEDIRHQYAAAW